MRFKKYLLGIITSGSCVLLYAQPSADFTVSPAACLNESLQITNQSQNTIAYQWDFCQGDLAGQPTAINLGGSLVTNNSPRINLVYDGSNWFGFVINYAGNSISRLDFGLSIDNPSPVVTDLGNIDNAIISPRDIELVFSNGKWYGFVLGDNTATLTRLDFGTTLTTPSNLITSAVLLTGSSAATYGGSVDIQFDHATGFYYILFTGINSLNVAKLSSIEAIPIPLDFISTGDIPASFMHLSQIRAIKSNGNWYAYVVSVANNKLFRFSFGPNLFSIPSYQDITGPWIGATTPTALGMGIDAGSYYLIVGTSGGLARVDLGSDLTTSPTGVFLGNLGVLQQINKMDLVKHNGVWRGFVCATFSSDLYRISFPHMDCGNPLSTTFDPVISYGTPGVKGITLRAYYDAVNYIEINKSVTVSSLPAPPVNIITTNSCVSSAIQFDYQSPQTITSFNWDLGDNTLSMLPNPTHQYTTSGDYNVSLRVTSSNGCNNLARKTITVYNEPIPNFNLPSASPICTNQDYLFTNTSVFDSGSNPSWQWEVNGVPISTTQDFTYSIPTAVMQDVKLKASIPGCSNEITKTINTVEEGPAANFTFTNDCEDKFIDFTNTTTGTVTGYSWDFGDGNNSTQTNGTNTFADFGQYNVTLEATNAAGCVNTSVQEITIYSKPQPDFSIDLPPFSCAGSSSQFNDLTANPTDSNLAGWTWSFGDPLNGTSNVRNAVYTFSTAAQYDVNLEVSTNFGCKASVQKAISISQSPDPAFSFNPACVNQATIFTPTSTSGVNSWQWKIGTSTYNQQSPTHVFSFPSAYTAKLTATGANGCVAVLTKPVIVPTAASVDFISENNCATQNASFTDLTTTGSDPISTRTWQFGTLGTGTGMTPTFNFPTSGSYPVKLTVTSEAGCSYSISKNVDIVNAPVVTFNATPLTGVPPLTVKFQNTSANSVAQLWKVNDADNSTSSENSPSFVFSELGQYVVDLTVVNADGCSNTQSKVISVITPSLDIELVNLTLVPANNGEANLLLTLLNNSNSPVSHIKAIIDVAGDALISEVINAVILPGESHSQILSTGIIGSKGNADFVCVELAVDGDVNYTNNKLCINTGSTIVVFDPYPNPGSDQLNLDWVANSPGASEVYIFDRTGRKVFDNTISNYLEGFNHLTISLAPLNPGLYYVLFVADGNRKSFPFVLRR